MRRFALLIVLFCMIVLSPLQAQDSPPPFTPPTVSTFREALIFAGPGPANQQVGILYQDTPVKLVERNNIGNWVHIQQYDAPGTYLIQEGWILSGYLNDRSLLNFADIPVNTSIPENNPDYAPTFSSRELYALPYIPVISPAMLDVYQRGQLLGNHANVITKVGDSLSASREYLTPMSSPQRALNAYNYLNNTVDTYGASIAAESAAAQIGLSSFAVVDPMWADPALGCQPGETPLDCEYRIRRPSVAFIMFGPNDVRAMTDVGYAEQMRAIIQRTLDLGIIPVVSTFSVHPDDEFAAQATNFNRQLITVANEFQIPLINLWAAARVLPNYGLDVDNIHLTYSGYDYLFYEGGNEAYSGVALHNLLSIRTLYSLQDMLANAGLFAEATPDPLPATLTPTMESTP
jgi:hypothetical protein